LKSTGIKVAGTKNIN